jgi:hypothetical protein
MKVVAHEHVSVRPNLVDPDGDVELIEEPERLQSSLVANAWRPLPIFVATAGNVIKSSRIVYP